MPCMSACPALPCSCQHSSSLHATAVLVICLAQLRLRMQWRRWEQQAQAQEAGAAVAAQDGASPYCSSGTNSSRCSSGGEEADKDRADGEAACGPGNEGMGAADGGERLRCPSWLGATGRWLREAAVCTLQALLPNTGAPCWLAVPRQFSRPGCLGRGRSTTLPGSRIQRAFRISCCLQ